MPKDHQVLQYRKTTRGCSTDGPPGAAPPFKLLLPASTLQVTGTALRVGRLSYQVMVVTELCEGGDLAKALQWDQVEPRVTGWYNRGHSLLLDVAYGLAYLHSNKVGSQDSTFKLWLMHAPTHITTSIGETDALR